MGEDSDELKAFAEAMEKLAASTLKGLPALEATQGLFREVKAMLAPHPALRDEFVAVSDAAIESFMSVVESAGCAGGVGKSE